MRQILRLILGFNSVLNGVGLTLAETRTDYVIIGTKCQ